MSGALAVVRPTKVRKEAKITCLVSFAPVFSFIWGRENWMFCLVCLPGVSWLLFEYISSYNLTSTFIQWSFMESIYSHK